ncbi:hypothetical protein NBRC110019_27160 [Neptunitalea chrysea]|uniref:HTH araC/xylS-type domain-containing protein n=1 Tax=Neptunitalea chrysea TaxID=1647581 RepID=A0A9W6EUM0_9FLAO|nr:AraC family transcriptional regulator [Neptunitalea chrysea]GLB53675.1 hypothetical protein NBRC110019_27160 [Neptunitalea chrysea]
MRHFLFNDTKYGFKLDMDLHRFENNPHLDFEPNIHTIDFFEIMIFKNGNVNFHTNGFTVPIKNGTVLFASPNQIKKCPIENNTAKGFHLLFKSAFLEQFFEDKMFVYRLFYFYNLMLPPTINLSQKEYNLLEVCLTEMELEIQNPKPDSTEVIRSLLFFILIKLNRIFKTTYHVKENFKKNEILIEYKKNIEKHINTPKNVSDYASILGLSPASFQKKIKEITGRSALELLNQRKLQEIKTRLLFSDKTVAEIAFDLNFSDPNNLTRFFKRLEGISPSLYRSQQSN